MPSHGKHIFPSSPSPQVSTTASPSARRRLVVDVNVSQRTPQRNPSVHNRADSLSSNTSTSSTLVDNAEASMPVYLGDEHVMMQLNYMLPISEYPEDYIPPSPTSSLQPESTFVTPCSSSANLLSHSSSAKQRLWLYRHKRSPVPRKSPPSSPSDTHNTQSLLAALLQARWPKTESEQPILGQTAPRAISPFRGKQRPPSAASMPRSILRTDSRCSPRTIKSPRSLGCVKFAEQPGVWEFNRPEEEEIDEYGEHIPHIEWRTPKDSDGDSIITLPPPGERAHNDNSFFKRFIGVSSNKHTTKSTKDRPIISGPMPLARASSLRQMKEANRSHTELLKEISKGPPKKENKLRSLMGRYLRVS